MRMGDCEADRVGCPRLPVCVTMSTWVILLTVVVLVLVAVWPNHGLLARWRMGRRLAARVRREDALKHLLKAEANSQPASLESVAGAVEIRRGAATELLADMDRRGLVSFEHGDLRLRPSGRELALHVIRTHRLWERHLAENTGVDEREWHRRAEREEHRLSPEQTAALAAALGNPELDPHGDVIPVPGGTLPPEPGQPLGALAPNAVARIVHVEDEPQVIYAQLTALGIRPGMSLCVLEKSPQRIRFWADGREHVLAPMLANNISVALLPEYQPSDLFEEQYLASLEPGQQARILSLSPACRGAERRRLLDLGFVPGTVVLAELASPGGDPTAYRVRETSVALRREQASLIRITAATAAPVS